MLTSIFTMDNCDFILLKKRSVSGNYLTPSFSHLLIIFANSLDPDQDRQNVGPDLDPNRGHSDSIPERFLF